MRWIGLIEYIIPARIRSSETDAERELPKNLSPGG